VQRVVGAYVQLKKHLDLCTLQASAGESNPGNQRIKYNNNSTSVCNIYRPVQGNGTLVTREENNITATPTLCKALYVNE